MTETRRPVRQVPFGYGHFRAGASAVCSQLGVDVSEPLADGRRALDPEFSIELAVLLLVLALVAAWRGVPNRAAQRVLIGGCRFDSRALSGCHRAGFDGAVHQPVLGQPAHSSSGGHVRGQCGRLAVDASDSSGSDGFGRVGRPSVLGVRRSRGRTGSTGRPALAGCSVSDAAGVVRRRSIERAPTDRTLVRAAGFRNACRAIPVDVGRDRVPG